MINKCHYNDMIIVFPSDDAVQGGKDERIEHTHIRPLAHVPRRTELHRKRKVL